MSQTKHTKDTKQTAKSTDTDIDSGIEALRNSPMMVHLLNALEQGTDIGHYGRLTFVMVARHFLSEDELIKLLSHQPDHNTEDFSRLVRQVKAHDYNPPKRERILEWQSQQDFPICPTPDEPSACNVYQELRFPDGIYDNISEYYEEQVKAEEEEDKG